ncbi:protein-glutamate O-methyltransferase CheR [Pelosinus sp. UFO1]|uniref:CheR family methyltransferase n=1 Tax=Pelosinus sp. UFO1 TaxID=484770 RepID=UPI0004D0C9AA|nr:protein-glutamate O-methyltransferase CheR [Pelosinus sp. UFO1]AIF53361.1 MCP methyltransferase, CheR-type [Pelosinus sp. UFO1]
MSMNLSSQAFHLFQKYIEEQCGIVIRDEKAYLIESRLSKFLITFGLSSFDELYCMLSQQKQTTLAEQIIDAITTNETLWFRDKTPWQALEEKLLPDYVEKIRQGVCGKIRIWSAACATGQEPYSIAMCIDNYLAEQNIKDITLDHFEIIATDISHTVLRMAKMGKYDNISMVRGMQENYRDKYFRQDGRIWLLDEKIKNSVQFRQFNLQNSFTSLGLFDVIFFRYVAIYFSEQFKEEVFRKINKSLLPKGVLILGNSEVFLDYKECYEAENYKNANLYRVRSGSCENIISR